MAKILWTGKESSKLLRSILWRTEALALKLLWLFVAGKSPEQASLCGKRVMSWLGPKTKKHRHIVANMRIAFPDKADDEIHQIAADIWGTLGSVLAEYVHLEQLVDIDSDNPYTELIYKTENGLALTEEVPRIYIAAHIANWELSSLFARKFSKMPNTIYGPQNNLVIENMIQKKRAPLNCGFTNKINGVRALYKSMKAGESVGMMADVRIDAGPMTPFFGLDAASTPTPAWLSLKTKCDIVPVQVERFENAHFRVTVHQPLRTVIEEGETSEQAIARVTGQIASLIEGWVRADPGQWWCNKHRWAKDVMKARGAYRA